MTTYSFKDLAGALFHPLVGGFALNGGNIGLGRITIEMTTERTVHDVSADGSVMVSYIAGDNGTMDIEVQQTSDLHDFLVTWFNAVKVPADLGDVSTWAAMTASTRNLVDGTSHYLSGMSPTKLPNKVYAAQGEKLVWHLMAANSIQLVTS